MSERKRSKLSLNKNAEKAKQDEYRLIPITSLPPPPVSQEPMLISWREKNPDEEEEWGALNMEDLLPMTIREIENYFLHDQPPAPIITIGECSATNEPTGEESIKKAASDFLQNIRNVKEIMEFFKKNQCGGNAGNH